MNTEQRALTADDALYNLICRLNSGPFNPSEIRAELVRIRALSPPASAGEGLSDDEIRAEWRKAGGEFYGPIVEHASIKEADYFTFRRSLATPTPPAAAQEDGRSEARRERDRLFCEAIVANQFQDEHRGGRLTVDVETLLHYFNENRPDAAMLTSPDSGKEGDRGQ
jgi:hypothetical protein